MEMQPPYDDSPDECAGEGVLLMLSAAGAVLAKRCF